MLSLTVIIIGLPLTILIFVALLLMKRPVRLERAAEIAGTAIGILLMLPTMLLYLLSFLVGPFVLILAALTALKLIFGLSLLPSLVDALPAWRGVPIFFWFAGSILLLWAILSWRDLYRWLNARWAEKSGAGK